MTSSGGELHSEKKHGLFEFSRLSESLPVQYLPWGYLDFDSVGVLSVDWELGQAEQERLKASPVGVIHHIGPQKGECVGAFHDLQETGETT